MRAARGPELSESLRDSFLYFVIIPYFVIQIIVLLEMFPNASFVCQTCARSRLRCAPRCADYIRKL